MEYKDKVMKAENPETQKPQRKPEFIFANWREMLNQLGAARGARQAYAVAWGTWTWRRLKSTPM